jgi:class 3 adenylate cyclase/predicted ATPase
MNVAEWLRSLGLEQYEAAFRENDVDGELLPDLTESDLKGLGVTSIGHRRRLLKAIAGLRLVNAPTADSFRTTSATAVDDLTSPEIPAERRPLSVMFCDLIGSTALSSQLDPEDLREIICSYQACVASTIRQFDGFIARYVGDGILIYFGWPEAGETDAERAVRASLAVAAAVSGMPTSGGQLQVRIGIATGLVVIGEPIGSGDSRQQTAVGETPNVAARLQGLAGPGQVVIDAATRRQIGELFECQDLGTVELKGLPVAVPAWQVVSENRTLGHFEALRSGATPLVGRDEEMELLLRRWAQAKGGSGRVVLISAEPGVGKSRLAEALAERIADEPHTRLRYFCSPHHQDSALYPVIAQMERATGFAHTDAPMARLAKLQSLLAATASPIEDVVLIADLHALPSADLAPPLDLAPQRKKEKTFEALLRQVEGLSQQQPLLMIFDDLHWIDPSSRELLDRVSERIAEWPVLLLAMFRPEFQPPWIGQPHVTMLMLPRLDRRDTVAMVANVARNAALSSEIIEEIAERTDGVPLFVEELTKAVLESGAQAGAALSAVPHPSVPATLHASLMARLDRLGPAAKDVAQTAAAIGREFGFELLASTTDQPGPQLHAALDRLTSAGLLFVRGTPPQSSYIFKHALVQDAAYGTLLRSRRQLLHTRIAATLEDRFPEIIQAQPSLLAQHCAAAGLVEQAVTYWLRAGQQALARSAMAEAVSQLRKGLDTLADLPDGSWCRQQELALQFALGPALIATRGWNATEVEGLYRRAQDLARQLGNDRDRFNAAWGLWFFHTTNGEPNVARELVDELFGVAERLDDAALRLQAHHAAWPSALFLGELTAAREHVAQGLALYDPEKHRAHAFLYGGHDTAVCGKGQGAVALWLLGYPDQAARSAHDAVSFGERLAHVPSLAHALLWGALVHQLRRDRAAVLACGERLIALGTEHGLPQYRAVGSMARGWVFVHEGQVDTGLAELRQALNTYTTLQAKLLSAYYHSTLAEAYHCARDTALGLAAISNALDLSDQTTERFWRAGMLHLKGNLLLSASASRRTDAESCHREALRIARTQDAKSIELRAALALARLWRDQAKHKEAHDLLNPICNWFTEGFDAPDLRDAKALLEQLTP